MYGFLLGFVFFSLGQLVFGVGLDGSSREVIDFCEFFAGGHKVIFADNVKLETFVVVVVILIEAFLVHGVGFVVGWKDERLRILEEGIVSLGVRGLDHRRHLARVVFLNHVLELIFIHRPLRLLPPVGLEPASGVRWRDLKVLGVPWRVLKGLVIYMEGTLPVLVVSSISNRREQFIHAVVHVPKHLSEPWQLLVILFLHLGVSREHLLKRVVRLVGRFLQELALIENRRTGQVLEYVSNFYHFLKSFDVEYFFDLCVELIVSYQVGFGHDFIHQLFHNLFSLLLVK
jgi:hypothetical protein